MHWQCKCWNSLFRHYLLMLESRGQQTVQNWESCSIAWTFLVNPLEKAFNLTLLQTFRYLIQATIYRIHCFFQFNVNFEQYFLKKITHSNAKIPPTSYLFSTQLLHWNQIQYFDPSFSSANFFLRICSIRRVSTIFGWCFIYEPSKLWKRCFG